MQSSALLRSNPLLGGFVVTLAQIAIGPSSTITNFATSDAIATVIGVFGITYPCDPIKTVLFLGWFASVRFIPALFLVGFGFLMQLLNEVGPVTQIQMGGVAYMAPIGGFLFSLLRILPSYYPQPCQPFP